MTTSTFSTLNGQQYMNLTTFRKSGEAMITPVWFAQEGDTLYMFTTADAGKVKRIRNSGRVQVSPSDRAGKPLGSAVDAHARLLNAAEGAHADVLLSKKYGLMKRLIGVVHLLRRSSNVYIAITQAPGAAL